MKKIKKYSGIIVLMLVGAVCGGLTVMELEAMRAMDLPFWQYLLTLVGMVLVLYLAFFLQIIVHEAGHLVCGLLTGHRFSSFRVGSFMWIRQEYQAEVCPQKTKSAAVLRPWVAPARR